MIQTHNSQICNSVPLQMHSQMRINQMHTTYHQMRTISRHHHLDPFFPHQLYELPLYIY